MIESKSKEKARGIETCKERSRLVGRCLSLGDGLNRRDFRGDHRPLLREEKGRGFRNGFGKCRSSVREGVRERERMADLQRNKWSFFCEEHSKEGK